MKKREKTLFVGIDVASRTNVAAFLDENNQQVIKPLEIPNNQRGVEFLEEKIEEVCQRNGFGKVKVGTEATSFYDFHLVDYLAESERLSAFDSETYRFNPKTIHHFKKVLKDQGKTDFVDAEAIAKRLKFGSLSCPYSSLKDYQSLQRLTRYRFYLIRRIVQEKGFLLSHLFLKNSSLCRERPIKRILGKTSRVLISEYLSAEEIANASLDELTQLIIKASRNRYKNPEEISRLVQRVSRESYRIRPSLARSLDLILASCFKSIQTYQDSLKKTNQAIAEELKGFRETLTSIPGIGPVFAAGILSEIAEISRFRSPDVLAKYTGLWWPKNQSGEFDAEERRLKKAGNKYLRSYLVEAANSLRVHNEEYKAFYQKKYTEVRRHQHKRALVLTARKLVRLVFSLLKTRQLYQEER